jgi:hypothetical protein
MSQQRGNRAFSLAIHANREAKACLNLCQVTPSSFVF